MTDIRGLVQKTLDGALSGAGVFSYWRRKSKTKNADPNEYAVYTLSSDGADFYADDAEWVKTADVTVIYYYNDLMLTRGAGRRTVKAREAAILAALETAGFSVTNFDGGDIDDAGFETIIFECSYSRCV
jgi:hypothetical protein